LIISSNQKNEANNSLDCLNQRKPVTSSLFVKSFHKNQHGLANAFLSCDMTCVKVTAHRLPFSAEDLLLSSVAARAHCPQIHGNRRRRVGSDDGSCHAGHAHPKTWIHWSRLWSRVRGGWQARVAEIGVESLFDATKAIIGGNRRERSGRGAKAKQA
jgi:hypothetical protein